MSFHKRCPFTYAMSLVLMPVYLFIVVLHFFFIPDFLENTITARKTIYKSNNQLVYYLIRNDRSVFNESKTVKTIQKKKSHQCATMLIDASTCETVLKYSSLIPQFSPNYHDAWLSNHILRI
jgi:predicted PurR-regulated permease PerM